jgi:suppressor for copper-sensitivity B
VIGFIAFAFLVPTMLGGPTLPTAAIDGTSWQPFARTSIPRLVAEGKTVVVDVTAEWCLTCQVNKRLVLTDTDVAARLKAPDVVTLRADWTRPDPTIAEYLASHGRYGIPFNIVYGPGQPDGLVLPELLTTTAMLEALETAKRR